MLGQVAGLPGDAALLLGQPLCIGRAFGLALQRLLQPNQPLDFFDVFLEPLLFALEAVGAVLAHQQFEQRLKIGLNRRLPIDGPFELLLIEQLHEAVELRLGQLLFRLLDGPRQKLRPLGIRQPFQLRHLEHELLELGVFVGDAALFEGQLIGDGGHRTAASGFACS